MTLSISRESPSSIVNYNNNTLANAPSTFSKSSVQPTSHIRDIDGYFQSAKFLTGIEIQKTKNSLNEMSYKIDEFIGTLSHLQSIVERKCYRGLVHSIFFTISRLFFKTSIRTSLDVLEDIKKNVAFLQPKKGVLSFLDAEWQKAVRRQKRAFQSQGEKIEAQIKSARKSISRSYEVQLDQEPPSAIDRPINQVAAKAWVQAHSEETREVAQHILDNFQYINFETFEKQLEQTCDSFNQYMDKLPLDERFYVISVRQGCKSDRWVSALAQKYLKYAPVDVVTHEDLGRKYPDIKHVVLLDDAAYSGLQMTEVLEGLKTHKLSKIHALIPYMTSNGEKKLTKMGGEKLILHPHVMLSTIEEKIPNIDIQQKIYKMYTDSMYNDDLWLFSKPFLPQTTMTYFAHKFPDIYSTLQVNNGKVYEKDGTCKERDKTGDCLYNRFIPIIDPPYSEKCWQMWKKANL